MSTHTSVLLLLDQDLLKRLLIYSGNSWTLDETLNWRVVATCPQDWKGPPQSHDGCLVLAPLHETLY